MKKYIKFDRSAILTCYDMFYIHCIIEIISPNTLIVLVQYNAKFCVSFHVS
jgi:hypothetical protein